MTSPNGYIVAKEPDGVEFGRINKVYNTEHLGFEFSVCFHEPASVSSFILLLL